MRHKLIPLLIAIVSLLGTLHHQSGHAKPLTKSEKVYILSSFWKEVTYNFAHWESTGSIDWDKTYQEFLPLILRSENDFEFYRLMQKFCAHLKDGHTNIRMPRGLVQEYMGRLPISLEAMGERAIVKNIDIRFSTKLPIGSEILETDGETINQLIGKSIPYISTSAPHTYPQIAIRSLTSNAVGILFGPKNKKANLLVREPTGKIKSVELPRDYYETETEWAATFPERDNFEIKTFR